MSVGSPIKLVDIVALGLLEDARKLISKGYSVHEKDKFGNTPAIIAASRNDYTMLETLIKSGASVDDFNDDGQNCSTWAKVNGNQQMLDLIKKHSEGSKYLRNKSPRK